MWEVFYYLKTILNYLECVTKISKQSFRGVNHGIELQRLTSFTLSSPLVKIKIGDSTCYKSEHRSYHISFALHRHWTQHKEGEEYQNQSLLPNSKTDIVDTCIWVKLSVVTSSNILLNILLKRGLLLGFIAYWLWNFYLTSLKKRFFNSPETNTFTTMKLLEDKNNNEYEIPEIGFFEGTEKLLEIWFHSESKGSNHLNGKKHCNDKKDDLRNIPR